MARKPLVALVGRPNVGKSTLFNKIIGERRAIINDLPGTTRDRLYGEGEWIGREFMVIDTGGFLLGDEDTYASRIRDQVKIAMQEADVIVFVVDVLDGVTPADRDIADMLRRTARPVILAANKAETQKRRLDAVEFYELGLGEPIPITAIHGTGVGDLLDAVVAHLPVVEAEEEENESIKIAIVGRPNVGKSSLLNKLVREERVIVSDVPGTTRDAIDTKLVWHGEEITLIDTAGIRRRGRIGAGVERYSVMRAMRAIERADVTFLLIDATQGVTAQDTHVAGYILEEFKSVVVVVNKWDLIEKDTYTLAEYERQVRAALNFMDYVPVVFISALTGQRVNKVLDLALQVYEERFKRVPTGELNRLLAELTARHAPPSEGRRYLRLRYATQAAVDPPTFVFFVNHPDMVHFSYERYIENNLRERYGFLGTPLRLRFRSTEREEASGRESR
ncbi:MAG: ribosome biogenesis GTPase Der [Ardenticatenaceae bacterium]|nr:ribosome biogenesis GTPase Der [Ardenticatenaceae bacterium]HBY98646.1 ribosome biogenesis GTPase Der [Chloroflexota bacterium]